MIATKSFVNSVENPEQNVNNRIDDEKRKNIIRNRHIVKCVSKAILFCGRQCIAPLGDNEVLNEDSRGNTGNFLAALQMIANHDDILKQHLDNIQLSSSNITYMSPLIENEIIEIIGQDMILKNLLEEIKAAKLYSIMADEVTNHNKEQLALGARFIDKNNDVREDFIAFIHLPRITGEVIGETIVSTLQGLGLEIVNVRGQGYDGAANMSSDNVGVQRRIRERSPKAVYVHCSGHCPSLVISHSCALPQFRNVIDKLKRCYLYFLGSPTREGLLQSIITKAIPKASSRKGLIDMCRTRWAARHTAYTYFYQAYPYVIAALKNISCGANHEMCGDEYQDAAWDRKSKDDAVALLASLATFDFLVSLLVLYEFLCHLSGVTVKLQGQSIDIIKAYQEIAGVKRTYNERASKMDEEFAHVYKQGWQLGKEVGHRVVVKSFAGATTSDMSHYVKPTLDKKPDQIILHAGTNDLGKLSPSEIADNIVDLAREIESSTDAQVIISELVTRSDLSDSGDVDAVNKRLRKFCNQRQWHFILHDDIHSTDLNRGGLHLGETDLSVLAPGLLCLVQSMLCDRTGPDLPNADEIINTYKGDPPSPEFLRQELLRFQIRYSLKPKEDRPNTAAKALKECNDDLFPNIYALLKICATIPATSCEYEEVRVL
ncbi:Zinc finger MYM-type protein 1 [Stylophora pistillata]|uniref:Zinc finger MYM-type protein 1 n=1 Tax=Stylophora pistillata TaxID=50429 RepID=A0A2B4SYX1_STYPI|nr:Zinc finger MYM-type protein 1 [Stylophora pistillata]